MAGGESRLPSPGFPRYNRRQGRLPRPSLALRDTDFAVAGAFGQDNIDYAMLVKIYGHDSTDDSRYSPAVCIDCKPIAITGQPEAKHISTSYVERSHLTMRMQCRRFGRLTNAFSKTVSNHAAAVSLHIAFIICAAFTRRCGARSPA